MAGPATLLEVAQAYAAGRGICFFLSLDQQSMEKIILLKYCSKDGISRQA
jgi:hypothetical protein